MMGRDMARRGDALPVWSVSYLAAAAPADETHRLSTACIRLASGGRRPDRRRNGHFQRTDGRAGGQIINIIHHCRFRRRNGSNNHHSSYCSFPTDSRQSPDSTRPGSAVLERKCEAKVQSVNQSGSLRSRGFDHCNGGA